MPKREHIIHQRERETEKEGRETERLEAGEMTQQLKELTQLSLSSFRGSNTIIWPPRAPGIHIVHIYIHSGKHSCKLKRNKSFTCQIKHDLDHVRYLFLQY